MYSNKVSAMCPVAHRHSRREVYPRLLRWLVPPQGVSWRRVAVALRGVRLPERKANQLPAVWNDAVERCSAVSLALARRANNAEEDASKQRQDRTGSDECKRAAPLNESNDGPHACWAKNSYEDSQVMQAIADAPPARCRMPARG